MTKKNYNSFVVLKQSEKDRSWGILNIVPIIVQPSEHEDAAEARSRREAYKKMSGWSATLPGIALRVVEAITNTCKEVNNHHGFVA